MSKPSASLDNVDAADSNAFGSGLGRRDEPRAIGRPGPARSRRRYFLNFAALVAASMVFASLINSVGVIVLQSIRTLGITKQQAGALEPFVDMPMAFSSVVIGAVLPSLGLRRALF
jgi:hypothetical protein